MRLEGAIGTTLTGLALAAVLCLEAAAQSPPRQGLPEASPLAQSPALPGVGGMAGYEGLIVEKIDFPDLPSANTKRLLDLIPQKVGAPLQREGVRESIQALYATGRLADIQAEAEQTADGRAELTFRMRANFFVGEIFVTGEPNPPAANQVVNASKLQLGELFTREKMERALTSIKQLMEQNGYYQSRISDEEQAQTETQQMNVVFRIAAGSHARVGHVTVTGQAGFSVGEIEDIAKMHTADYVTVQRTSRALERLRKKYQKQDRLLSQVAISSRTYRSETNTVDYTFEIQPGPKVEITVEGFKISHEGVKGVLGAHSSSS